MTELCDLAKKYGADKCPTILHTYTPEYYKLFEPHRASFRKFVEIGIGTVGIMRGIVGSSYKPGASLRMWRDFFPNATVIGCDIVKEVMITDEERIQTFVADQSKAESLEELAKKIGEVDCILDDGSHNPTHMILSIKTLWKCIRPDGFYVIEDIRANDRAKFEALTNDIPNAKCIQYYAGPKHQDHFIVFQKQALSV